ncbi:MAG: 50S ribosomal protein L24 [Candidatus Phytoplasma stylosanthis]|uniref:50S ribosomal protein L24 n=1 Tax=Candidatus Phytoplasma stylosanthis TaxID=2798314 RepID=UPI002939B2AB|nr:50S ribosomal protein L24 [Candidatus Phytoplasma stylosanthis]MDV3167849.1 50S ribosomal protein L24 [Candidatus Phytoplasma stylosanthis]MDV3170875.1 50S ribosomal protein L24 [Candidatus Phytoplasma stylosanthis]MDV3173499.1 50S ribosomal protein L24 [Candidatus Phytoplasma stylosanthis]MDV3174055.1 50S ribosomal protein L24 [Candidatus Phytoplasma stylosanthis]MDV3202433.1 50S ribosomal protein L24 [Candidatus Phytoplasma stylosanthis]
MYIKLGDIVAIRAGKDRFFKNENGEKTIKSGKVVKIFFQEQRVLVEGINIATKHKATTKEGEKGNIIKEEMPIHVSNLSLIDPEKKIPTRVGFRFENGKKVRYSKKTGITI